MSDDVMAAFSQAVLSEVRSGMSVGMIQWIVNVEKQLIGLSKRVRELERAANMVSQAETSVQP